MSNARIGDIERRLSNVVRPGTILEADYATARVKVALGKNKTAWLPWITGRAGNDRTWHAPEVGEQVIVIAPSGELAAGYVLQGAIYKTDFPANGASANVSRITYSDGAISEYDRAAHAHLLNIPSGGKATVKVGTEAFTEITASKITHQLSATAKAEISAASIKLTLGSTIIEMTSSGITLTGSAITIHGPVTQTGGNLTSDGIGLQTHRHSGVQSGSSSTSTPTA